MRDILEDIVANKRIEVECFKKMMPECQLHKAVEKIMATNDPLPSMRKALTDAEVGIIAEFKRKSPSKGWIKEDGMADVIPLSYQKSGAAALSILTDEKYFGGKDEYITMAIDSGVTIPLLYKNFIIDEYQLFQARLCGASAVLLIAADLRKDICRQLLCTAHELNMEVLLEMHNDAELEYVELEPDMCGINNRNLGTFVTDVQNSFRLADKLPKNTCKVSESGISKSDTVAQLKRAGFNGFLIGENFMRSSDPGTALKLFIDEVKKKMAIC